MNFDIRKLLESFNEISEAEIPNDVMDRVLEALELAIDTIRRRDEVTDETFNFTVKKLSETLKLIDPHHTYKTMRENGDTPDRGHNSPYDLGVRDAYYGRKNPPTDPEEEKEYWAGYDSSDERKDWGR